MQRSTKGKLQGSAIHDYRHYFNPTSDSYDCGNLEKHSRRMLLKAEPQSGKTQVTVAVSSYSVSQTAYYAADSKTCKACKAENLVHVLQTTV